MACCTLAELEEDTMKLQPSEWLPEDPKEVARVIKEQGLLQGSGRVAQFMGLLVAADFDLTAESLAPHVGAIWDKVLPLEERLDAGEFDKIELGIYNGEVRAWAVHGG